MPHTRTPIAAGNWKMNVSPGDAVPLVRSMRDPLGRFRDVEVVFFPTALALATVSEMLRGSPIAVGAQNCHWETKGAYTGEIAAPMLQGLAQYVLVGHSERRAIFGDTDEAVRRKVEAVLRAGLTPMLCVGEELAEREAGQTTDVVARQVIAALDGLAIRPERMVVAYEPVWAIGTGVVASVEQAQEMHGAIRAHLAKGLGGALAGRIRILYGGSVKPDNVRDLLAEPDLDGALVGGASLTADSFLALIPPFPAS